MIGLPELPELTGEEPLLPGAQVRDFWAWALGDLRLNANRGMLAQFLVARAVGDGRPRDDGWGDFDVLSAEGVKVEVTSSGYLQSWQQLGVSQIRFSGLKGRSWNGVAYSDEAEFRADVYVFAVHTCTEPDRYDPLDLAAWEFWVAPRERLAALDQASMALATVRRIAAGPMGWDRLGDEVRAAAGL